MNTLLNHAYDNRNHINKLIKNPHKVERFFPTTLSIESEKDFLRARLGSPCVFGIGSLFQWDVSFKSITPSIQATNRLLRAPTEIPASGAVRRGYIPAYPDLTFNGRKVEDLETYHWYDLTSTLFNLQDIIPVLESLAKGVEFNYTFSPEFLSSFLSLKSKLERNYPFVITLSAHYIWIESSRDQENFMFIPTSYLKAITQRLKFRLTTYQACVQKEPASVERRLQTTVWKLLFDVEDTLFTQYVGGGGKTCALAAYLAELACYMIDPRDQESADSLGPKKTALVLQFWPLKQFSVFQKLSDMEDCLRCLPEKIGSQLALNLAWNTPDISPL